LQLVRRCFEFLQVDASYVPRQLGLATNVTTQLRSEKPGLNVLRRIPLFNWAVRLFPLAWRDWVRSLLFTRRVRHRPRWNSMSLRRVLDELADDIQRFLTFYGKPANYWNLGAKL